MRPPRPRKQSNCRRRWRLIRARKSIPADGPFVYLKQGTDFVVRRKCDRAEMGRVAIAEVHSALIVVGG